MLVSCQHCGSIHQRNYECPKKPKRTEYKVTDIDKFRWTSKWKKKSKYIREVRDGHMCQVCIRKLHNTMKQYTFEGIEVHHIYPLAESEGWENRLNDECLVSLCKMHHEMAECGDISRGELLEIVREQEGKM